MRTRAVLLALIVLAAPATARCKAVRAQAARAGIRVSRKPAALLRAFNSRRAVRADLAYCRLARMGARGIDVLMGNGASTSPFAGTAWRHPSSSLVVAPPTQGVVSLWLVEAIVRGAGGEFSLAPGMAPRLTHATITDQATLQPLAAAAYRAWWDANRATPLDRLRAAGPYPLDATPLDWL